MNNHNMKKKMHRVVIFRACAQYCYWLLVHYTAPREGSAAINGHLCDFIAIVWQIDLKELDAKSVKIEGEKHWTEAFSSLC